MAQHYLDADTTPPIRGRYVRGNVQAAKRVAFTHLERVSEGQIGIYDNALGGTFHGYAIKNAGEAPYFEEPTGEAA